MAVKMVKSFEGAFLKYTGQIKKKKTKIKNFKGQCL